MRIILNKLYMIFYTCFINRNVKIGLFSRVSTGFLGHLDKSSKILIEQSIIGPNVRLDSGVKLLKQCEINGKVNIGKFTTINGPATRIQGDLEGVSIGNFCSIASGVIIQEDYHRYDCPTTYLINKNIIHNNVPEKTTKGKIVIEDDVWIGSNAVVLSGVKIGRGCVIGAGSVVTKSMPPYSIVAGNPAQVIKPRFCSEIVAELEKIKWWEWDENKIKENSDFFSQKLSIYVGGENHG